MSEASKVVGIHGASVEPDKPVPDVVDLCEALLADAKSGRLRALACAEARGNNDIHHSYAHGGYEVFRLAAAIMLLVHVFAAYHFKDDLRPDAR